MLLALSGCERLFPGIMNLGLCWRIPAFGCNIVSLGNCSGRKLDVRRFFLDLESPGWDFVQRLIIREIEEVDHKLDRIWIVIGQVYAGCAVFLDSRSASNLVEFLFSARVSWTYLHICFESGLEVF